MTKKSSKYGYLLSTRNARGVYVWIFHSSAWLAALVAFYKAESYGGKPLGWVAGIVTVVIMYKFISHWVALLVVLLETIMGGGRM